MWNPFKEKGKGGNASEPQVRSEQPNTVDALFNNLQQEGRFGELEQELEKLDQSSINEAEKAAWWHLYGIAAFRAGRDGEATSRFEEGHKRFPGNAEIRFSLGQQYVRAGKIQEGFDLFASCKFPEVPKNLVLAQVRYAYLWDRYPEGRAMLRPFLEAYKQLNILDDHFLYTRGLPFFGTWWSYLAALSILDRETENLRKSRNTLPAGTMTSSTCALNCRHIATTGLNSSWDFWRRGFRTRWHVLMATRA